MRQNQSATAKKTVPAMLADTDFLFRQAKLGSDAFTQAQPFPHLLLPSLIKTACCFALFEGLQHQGLKPEKQGLEDLPSVVRMLLWELSSSTLIRHFTSLTGKPPLLPDPFLIHSGAHILSKSEIVHTAEQEFFARHPETQLQNVLRMELFVASEASATFTMDMMNKQGHVGVSHIVRNGSVLFTNSDNYHLHYHFEAPASVKSAQWCSLIVYYYINDRARVLNGEEQPSASY